MSHSAGDYAYTNPYHQFWSHDPERTMRTVDPNCAHQTWPSQGGMGLPRFDRQG